MANVEKESVDRSGSSETDKTDPAPSSNISCSLPAKAEKVTDEKNPEYSSFDRDNLKSLEAFSSEDEEEEGHGILTKKGSSHDSRTAKVTASSLLKRRRPNTDTYFHSVNTLIHPSTSDHMDETIQQPVKRILNVSEINSYADENEVPGSSKTEDEEGAREKSRDNQEPGGKKRKLLNRSLLDRVDAGQIEVPGSSTMEDEEGAQGKSRGNQEPGGKKRKLSDRSGLGIVDDIPSDGLDDEETLVFPTISNVDLADERNNDLFKDEIAGATPHNNSVNQETPIWSTILDAEFEIEVDKGSGGFIQDDTASDDEDSHSDNDDGDSDSESEEEATEALIEEENFGEIRESAIFIEEQAEVEPQPQTYPDRSNYDQWLQVFRDHPLVDRNLQLLLLAERLWKNGFQLYRNSVVCSCCNFRHFLWDIKTKPSRYILWHLQSCVFAHKQRPCMKCSALYSQEDTIEICLACQQVIRPVRVW